MDTRGASGIRDKRIDDMMNDEFIDNFERISHEAICVTKLNESDPQGAIKAAAKPVPSVCLLL